jgi:3',5'-cyclic AMP phosphodiesterase CpdA
MAAAGLLTVSVAADAFWPFRLGPRKFAFATLSDVHLKDAKSASIFTRALSGLNADPEVRFVVLLGGLASSGLYRELNMAKVCLQSLKKPFFIVPGDGDLEPGVPDSYGNLKRVFEDYDWTEREGGWTFIGLDSCGGPDKSLRPDRMDWLKRKVRRIGHGRPIALFSYHPLSPSTGEKRLANAEEVLALFKGHNLRLVASSSVCANKVETVGDTLFVTSAACSTTVSNSDGSADKGYRVFRVSDGQLTSEFMTLVK